MREGGGVQYDRGGLPGLARPRGKSAMRGATVAEVGVDLQKLHVKIMNVIIRDACQTTLVNQMLPECSRKAFFQENNFCKRKI